MAKPASHRIVVFTAGLMLALVAAAVLAVPAAAGSFGKQSRADIIAQAALNEEITCLAQNIYFEARSEPVDGMLAVGHVVLNRVASDTFPGSICAVVRQGGERRRHRCQFSWWCDGRSDKPRDKMAWDAARLVAWFVYHGHTQDPTGGALWYHADYVDPHWREAFIQGPQIGRHIFYRDVASRS